MEQNLQLMTKQIIQKLQTLNCKLLGNSEDAWIQDLLFKPNQHRCSLIRWILKNLQYTSEIPTSDDYNEEISNLISVLSGLGIGMNHEVIKGNAPVKKQVEFWTTLVDVLWMKFEISKYSLSADKTEFISLENISDCNLQKEYESSRLCINKICEQVSVKHLFETDLQLLPPDVEKELDMLDLDSKEEPDALKELKTLLMDFNPVEHPRDVFKKFVSEKKLSFDVPLINEYLKEDELNEVEDRLSQTSFALQSTLLQGFSEAYNDLEPLVKSAESSPVSDIGHVFEEIEPYLNSLCQLKSSLVKLKSASENLISITSDLEDVAQQIKRSQGNKLSQLLADVKIVEDN